MLRAIICRDTVLFNGAAHDQGWSTLDFEAPELEARLSEGGFAEDHSHTVRLFACEVRPSETPRDRVRELADALAELLRCAAIPESWAEPARAALSRARGETP